MFAPDEAEVCEKFVAKAARQDFPGSVQLQGIVSERVTWRLPAYAVGYTYGRPSLPEDLEVHRPTTIGLNVFLGADNRLRAARFSVTRTVQYGPLPERGGESVVPLIGWFRTAEEFVPMSLEDRLQASLNPGA